MLRNIVIFSLVSFLIVSVVVVTVRAGASNSYIKVTLTERDNSNTHLPDRQKPLYSTPFTEPYQLVFRGAITTEDSSNTEKKEIVVFVEAKPLIKQSKLSFGNNVLRIQTEVSYLWNHPQKSESPTETDRFCLKGRFKSADGCSMEQAENDARKYISGFIRQYIEQEIAKALSEKE